MIETIIDRLSTGGIIDDLAVFDLDTPDPEYSVDTVSDLAIHAFDFGRRFNKADTNSVYNCPLVFDTGASTGISPFKSDFLDDYKNVTLVSKGLHEVSQLWAVVPFYGSLLLVVAIIFTYRPTAITCLRQILDWSLHSMLLEQWVKVAMPLLMCGTLNFIFLINGLLIFQYVQAPIYH